jgi:hypothetical protein
MAMKYTIMGFSQMKMIELDMDLNDCLILRYLIDFKDSGKMHREIIEDEVYYWVRYDELKKDIPIININSKDVLRRHIKKMVDNKILIHWIKPIFNQIIITFYFCFNSFI